MTVLVLALVGGLALALSVAGWWVPPHGEPVSGSAAGIGVIHSAGYAIIMPDVAGLVAWSWITLAIGMVAQVVAILVLSWRGRHRVVLVVPPEQVGEFANVVADLVADRLRARPALWRHDRHDLTGELVPVTTVVPARPARPAQPARPAGPAHRARRGQPVRPAGPVAVPGQSYRDGRIAGAAASEPSGESPYIYTAT